MVKNPFILFTEYGSGTVQSVEITRRLIVELLNMMLIHLLALLT